MFKNPEKTIKIFSIVLFFTGTIASLIFSIVCFFEGYPIDNLGFIVIIFGPLFSFISANALLILVNISNNIKDIKDKLEK